MYSAYLPFLYVNNFSVLFSCLLTFKLVVVDLDHIQSKSSGAEYSLTRTKFVLLFSLTHSQKLTVSNVSVAYLVELQ